MALIDESEEAFRELLDVMPAEITFNGISKPCVSQTITLVRKQTLHGYVYDVAAQVSMLNSDFAAFVAMELKDRSSIMQVNGGEELVFMQKEIHPNSAVTHLFLANPT